MAPSRSSTSPRMPVSCPSECSSQSPCASGGETGAASMRRTVQLSTDRSRGLGVDLENRYIASAGAIFGSRSPTMTETNAPRRDAGLGGPVVDVHHHWLPRELVDHIEDCVPETYRVVRAEGEPIRIYDPEGVQEMAVEPDRYCTAA